MDIFLGYGNENEAIKQNNTPKAHTSKYFEGYIKITLLSELDSYKFSP